MNYKEYFNLPEDKKRLAALENVIVLSIKSHISENARKIMYENEGKSDKEILEIVFTRDDLKKEAVIKHVIDNLKNLELMKIIECTDKEAQDIVNKIDDHTYKLLIVGTTFETYIEKKIEDIDDPRFSVT